MNHRRIALIGGTGAEGLGLAVRFAAGGGHVLIGSRDAARAAEAVSKVKAAVPGTALDGGTNLEVADAASVAVVTVPYHAQAEQLAALRGPLAGKPVITAVVPMRFDAGAPVILNVAEGSAAQQAASVLAESRVAAAFQHLSAPKLMDLSRDMDADVIVCADDPGAKAEAIALASLIKGCRGLDGGGLANARHIEAMTAVLVTMNRIHKTRTALRVTGIRGG
jgi:NADPH-dependent F420 reductase